MVDLDHLADAAVAAPLAPAPSIRELRRRTVWRRRRRLVAAGTASLVVVGITVGIASTGHPKHRQVVATATTHDHATATATSSSMDDREMTTSALLDRLTQLGLAAHKIRSATVPSTVGAPQTFGVEPTMVCVERHTVGVYEYGSGQARLMTSRGVSRDGSFEKGSGHTIVHVIPEWIAPPHFFARGRLIVLYLGNNHSLTTALSRVLGPTLTPDVGSVPGREGQSCR